MSSDFIWAMLNNMRWLKTCGMERDFLKKMGKVQMPLSFKEDKTDSCYLPVIYQRFKVGKFMHSTAPLS